MSKTKTFWVHIVGMEYANDGKIGSGDGGGNFEWRFNKKDADKVFATMQDEKKQMQDKEPKCAVKIYRTACKIENVTKTETDTITELVEAYLEVNEFENSPFAPNEGRPGTQRSPFAPGS